MKQKILILLAGVLSLYGTCVYANEREFCAVVLHNSAKYSMEAAFDNVFVRRAYNRKIRINMEEGLRYVSVTIPYYRFMEYTERVGGIKALVYNGAVDEKGKPVVRRMPREHILDVRTDVNRWEKRFTVPGVMPGDTVEIRYEILGVFPEYYERGFDSPDSINFFTAFGFMTKYGIGEEIVFPKWDFQEDIPVQESSLQVRYFDSYRFGHVLYGYEDVDFTEKGGYIYPVMERAIVPRKHFSISTLTEKIINTGGIRPSYRELVLREKKFSASNLMPQGDTDEKYVINPRKYRASVEFDLKGRKIDIDSRGGDLGKTGDYFYSDSWTDVNKILLHSRFFGRKIFFTRDFYKDYADSVKNLPIPDYDKAQIICNHIRDDIECTSTDVGMYIGDLKDVYSSKSGSNVDICIMAYKALDGAGFKPKLVMLKNREKGSLHNGGISIGALDNMVVYTRLKDGRIVIFDPTGNPVDPRLINPMYLVKEGIVYNGGEEQVNLMNAVENKEYHNASLFIDSTGMVKGSSRSIFTNHSAYGMAGAEPQVNGTPLEISYGALDTMRSLSTREFSFERDFAVAVDGKLFINPFAEIFFKAEEFGPERKYPVEFRNPRTIEYTATLHIPDGYELYSLPRNSTIQQELCGTSATMLTKAQGKIVQFGLTIRLDNATIPLEHYGEFRQWWQQMCSMFEETVILRRKGGRSITDTEQMTV